MGRSVGHYHFAAWDLPTKHGWMHTGPGVPEGTRMQDLAKKMADRMVESGTFLRDLLGGAEWAGAAATAAGQAMRRGAEQIDQTAAGAATAQRCVTELGESFSSAQRRVPSPNEIPNGLGDKFAFGAAEGFNALSPFDVQSPIHDAMAQRRELDEQANQALTDHMNTSRERLDAIPVVSAPPPMTVSAQSVSGSGSGVGYPTGGVPANLGSGDAPTSTPLAGAAPGMGQAAMNPAQGAGSIPPGAQGPVNTGLSAADPAYRPLAPSPGQFGPAAGPGPGQAGFIPGVGGSGAVRGGGATTRGPGLGARPGPGGTGVAGRGVAGSGGGPGLGGASGLGGTSGLGGAPVPGGSMRGGDAGDVRGGPAGARGAGGHSFLQPPIGGRGQGDEDTEHRDRYAQATDHLVGTLPLVAPAVIGESPEEEAIRLRRAQEGS